jgi:hypothetical protein
VVLGVVLYDTFHPFPPAPFNWIVLTAGLSIVVGLIIARLPNVRDNLHRSPLLRAVARSSN